MFHSITDDVVDGYEPSVQVVDSYCFNCGKSVMVSSFNCDHCHYQNNSTEPIGKIKGHGQKIELEITEKSDLDRRVIQPAHSVVDLFELGQFPSKSGAITTIEGLIQTIIDNVKSGQESRKQESPQLYEQLQEFLVKMNILLKVEKPFKLVLDDPSGNGVIENPIAPKDDPKIKIEKYCRTKEQNQLLGFYEDNENLNTVEEEDEVEVPEEVLQFQSPCPNCLKNCKMNMKTIDIPYFKEVLIMALCCDACGYRDNEIKAGGGVAPKGRKYELKITGEADLKRDVLKSETGGIKIPEIEFEATHGTLSGKFTTVEGILMALYENLSERNPFVFGDSAEDDKKKVAQVVNKIKEIADGKMTGVHFILDDPAGNSYLQNYYAPDPDPEMKVVEYERNEEQNDFLGLTGMNTKDFETIEENKTK